MHMKAFFLPVLLLASLALAGCNGKVAVVNPDRVFQESNAVKSGMTYLEGLSAELQDELVAAQEEGRKNNRQRNAQAALQARVEQAQQRYNAEQHAVMDKVNSLFMRALETCRTKNRISMVVTAEAALSYDPKMDITQQVINEMNRTPVSFTPSASLKEEAKIKPAGQ